MASTSTAARLMTYEEWELLPEETEGRVHELIDGVHVVSPNPVTFHDLLFARLFRLLDRLIEAGRLGRLFGSKVDVKLADDVVVAPDLFFVRRERLHIVTPKAVVGPPDLVIEIFSPSTRAYDRTDKLAHYERSGVSEVWFIDPVNRTMIVNVLENGRYRSTIYREGDVVRTSLLPDLEIDVAALFAEAA